MKHGCPCRQTDGRTDVLPEATLWGSLLVGSGVASGDHFCPYMWVLNANHFKGIFVRTSEV